MCVKPLFDFYKKMCLYNELSSSSSSSAASSCTHFTDMHRHIILQAYKDKWTIISSEKRQILYFRYILWPAKQFVCVCVLKGKRFCMAIITSWTLAYIFCETIILMLYQPCQLI